MLSVFLALSLFIASSNQNLEREVEFSQLRISFQPVLGSFSEVHEAELLDRIVPAVQTFYASALRTQRIVKSLKPSVKTCGSVEVPEEHRVDGLEADVVIYLNAEQIHVPALGRSCEQEDGIFKRPLVGYIEIDILSYFNLFEHLQIQYLIRETAHVLAFDSDLIQDFVQLNGKRYSPSQYSTSINYPNRGKTVKTIAFPKMLSKARATFNCNIEGLETEDNFEEEGLENKSFFWDARIMTHDIMSSYMSDEVIFSDISLAVFEDSGWYEANFEYSQVLKWGNQAGCKWFQDPCLSKKKSSLPGFCSSKDLYNLCDVFGLGHGFCGLYQNENIPPHERYFDDQSLGGVEEMDFCPIVEVTKTQRCRVTTSSKTFNGEVKDVSSRCLMSSLIDKDQDLQERSVEGGCFFVITCSDTLVTLKINENIVSCPFGSKITVQDFKGYLHCPTGPDFCRNLPCKNMCSGKGKCLNGFCSCHPRWTGDDCSVDCGVTCQTCSVDGKCLICAEGYFMNSGICLPCEDPCLSCSNSAKNCISCQQGFEYVKGQCLENCIDHCSSCDSPCSQCDSRYFLDKGRCSPCKGNCKECQGFSENCVNCFEGMILVNNQCKSPCPAGCSQCKYPCDECMDGYFLYQGECSFCDNLCAKCSENSSHCSGCWPGYALVGNTCKQACKMHCLTCDEPCSKCEDGFFTENGECAPCSINCQTCTQISSICTSCKAGFKLKGASCESECVDHCESCDFPCEKCVDGYYSDLGQCFKCNENCKTCSIYSTRCDSCPLGYGIIYNACAKGCMDHCASCESPCSTCEDSFFEFNGVCISCDQSCRSCYGLGPDHCRECAEGYHKDEGLCKPDCQQHCLSCDEPCSLCEEGYFIYMKGCQKCDSKCKSCSNHSYKCTSCHAGSGLISDSCQEGCSPHCISCDSPCSKCENGYLSISGLCEECSSNCSTCESSPNNCLSCKFGYSLNNGICEHSCIDHCTTCTYPCSTCSPGFVSQEGICEACPPGCLSCSSDLTECYSCEDDYEYAHKSCSKICLPFCKSCDNPCTLCEPGYLSVFGTCVQCQHPCTSCMESTQKCTSCPPLYQLDNFRCHSDCLENCKSCDNPCSHCEDGFLIFKGLCEKCFSGCRTCESTPDFCTSCHPGKELNQNKCINVCIENCIDCSSPCRGCIQGYALNEGICLPCPNYMTSSSVRAEFIQDFTGLSLVFTLPILNRQNICELYFKPTAIALLGKGVMCNWDQAVRLVVIFGKNPEFNMKILEMFPIAAYGSDCNSKSSDFNINIDTGAVPLPVVSIVSPNYYSTGCGNEVLVIEGITPEKTFNFQVLTDPKITTIEDLARQQTGKKFLHFSEDILQPVNIHVTFTAFNFLGKSSSVSKIIVITTENKLSVSIDAGSSLKLTTAQTFSIRGVLPQSHCIDHSKLTFTWVSIHPSSSLYYSEVEEVLKTSKLSHVLQINPGILKASRSYVFRFEVYDKVSSGFSDIQVDVVDSPLLAVLDRSDSTFNYRETFSLSAKGSCDPGDRSIVLKFEWECMEQVETCTDVAGEDLLDDLNSDEINVGAFRMKPNTDYAFTVRVSHGTRIASRTVIITAVDSPGAIAIPSFVSTVNRQAEFSVFPKFQNVNESSLFKWAQVSGPSLMPSSSVNMSYFVIDAFSMISGHSYVFRLKAILGGQSISSDLAWTTNDGPKCGELETVIMKNSVSLQIDCYDGDYADFPLYYIYGLKTEESMIPLKVVHSPYSTFKLNPGEWNLYVSACDSLQTCINKTTTVKIESRRLQEIENLKQYNIEKVFPDNIPLAIFNSLSQFNKENFLEAFKDLRSYIKSQELDLVHLKMAIECLEMLTKSDRAHFYSVHQEEIVMFLTEVISELTFIDQEAMEYIITLFSEHKVNEYQLVSQLISKASEKWVFNMPPGESRSVIKKISIVRHRFIGHDTKKIYQLGKARVSDLLLEGDSHKIYDLLITVYPSSPSAIVDINYYEVGTYDSLSILLSEVVKEVQIDLMEPFTLNFVLEHPGDFSCVQLKGKKWVDEGCKVRNNSDSSVTMTSWHVSTFKVVHSSSTKRGYLSLATEILMLLLTIFTVSFFCIIDKNKTHYLAGAFDLESPRSANKDLDSPDDSPRKEEIQKLSQIPKILYHPTLNVFLSQNSDRRAASSLYFSSVLFAEFLSIGGLFNPKFNEIFDAEENFLSFSKAQITTGCVGLLFSQFLSAGVICLNQPGDSGFTKRYLGMAVSTLVIVFGSGIGIVFSLTYPAIYSFYWTVTFAGVFIVELVVMQNLAWLVLFKVFMKKAESNVSLSSRNMRVFTSDA